MRKILSVILAAVFCLGLAGCSSSKIPPIYQTITTKFIDNMCTMSSEEVKSFAESAGLELEKEYHGYDISNGGKWEASFNSTSEEFKVLSFHNWGKGHSIYISQSSIYYISGDYIKYFNSLADCEQYVFGETSGIDFTVEKKEETSSSHSTQISKPSNISSSSSTSLRFGKLLSKTVNGSTLVIKAKIEPSYNNKATVDQNYYNIENIIKKQGGDKYTEIQYWAVADMTNGSEQKVVSFTVSEAVIKKIANDQIVANQMGNYVDDLFIHASLR